MPRDQGDGCSGAPECEGENALLLREMAHRTANEFAVLRSALSIAADQRDDADRLALIRQTSVRLDRVIEVHRMLAAPPADAVDLARELDRLCRATLASRPDCAATRLLLDLHAVQVDGATARRLSLVAAELLHNACRHALAGRAGELRLSLRGGAEDVVLCVGDDGPGRGRQSPAAGGSLGSGIVAALIASVGGRIFHADGRPGVEVRLVVPLTRPAGAPPPASAAPGALRRFPEALAHG